MFHSKTRQFTTHTTTPSQDVCCDILCQYESGDDNEISRIWNLYGSIHESDKDSSRVFAVVCDILSAVYHNDQATFAKALQTVKNEEEYQVVLDVSGIVLDHQIREYFTSQEEIKLVKNEVVEFITNALKLM